jgi:hypothetical protein
MICALQTIFDDEDLVIAILTRSRISRSAFSGSDAPSRHGGSAPLLTIEIAQPVRILIAYD